MSGPQIYLTIFFAGPQGVFFRRAFFFPTAGRPASSAGGGENKAALDNKTEAEEETVRQNFDGGYIPAGKGVNNIHQFPAAEQQGAEKKEIFHGLAECFALAGKNPVSVQQIVKGPGQRSGQGRCRQHPGGSDLVRHSRQQGEYRQIQQGGKKGSDAELGYYQVNAERIPPDMKMRRTITILVQRGNL
jgi:hypothetical protein